MNELGNIEQARQRQAALDADLKAYLKKGGKIQRLKTGIVATTGKPFNEQIKVKR